MTDCFREDRSLMLLVTGTHEAFLEYSDLFNISFHGDVVQECHTRWDESLLSIKEAPSDDILESLCKMRIRMSDQPKTVCALYEQEIEQHESQLKTMVKRCMDQKIRARNLAARKERIEMGAPANGNRKSVSVGKKTGEYHQWEAKGQCTRGEACNFCHDENERGKALQPSCPAPEPQTQSHGKISSKGKALRGRSPSGKRCRRPCKDYISEKCTNPRAMSWQPPL